MQGSIEKVVDNNMGEDEAKLIYSKLKPKLLGHYFPKDSPEYPIYYLIKDERKYHDVESLLKDLIRFFELKRKSADIKKDEYNEIFFDLSNILYYLDKLKNNQAYNEYERNLEYLVHKTFDSIDKLFLPLETVDEAIAPLHQNQEVPLLLAENPRGDNQPIDVLDTPVEPPIEMPTVIDPTILSKFIGLIFKSYGLDSENKAYFKVEFQDIEPRLIFLGGELKIIGGNQKSYDTKSVTDVLDSLMSVDSLPEDKLGTDLRGFVDSYRDLAELFTTFQNTDLTKDTSKRESLVESFLRLVQTLKELSESTSLKKNLDDIKAEYIESKKTPLDKFRDNFKLWKRSFNEEDHGRMLYKDEIIGAIEQNLESLFANESIEITIKQKTALSITDETSIYKLHAKIAEDLESIISSLNLYFKVNDNKTFWSSKRGTSEGSVIFKIGLFKD